MLEKSFGLFFFLKQPKNQKSEERYVYIRITVDGISKEVSTKRIWSASRWDHHAGRAKGTKEDALALNTHLSAFEASVYSAKSQLMQTGKTITAVGIKAILTGTDESGKTVLQAFKEHNDKMRELVGKDYAEGTMERFDTAYDHVQSFIKWKYDREDLILRELNYDFISEYSFWLKAIRKCNHNTTIKYISNFKKVVLECKRKGWLRSDPFIEFKMTLDEVEINPLEDEEITAIVNKDFHTTRLNNVRDIFIFSCFTGLAYADVKGLTYGNITRRVDGNLWIDTRRQKTGTPIRVPLLPQALDIMLRYREINIAENTDKVLPVLSNQKMNAYLKEIADLCGITKNLTFHLARHTFATTVTLANGVPLESVSKMLSHKSIKQTQHYAKIVDLKVSRDMDVLRQKYSVAV